MTTPLLPYSSIRRRKKKRAETRIGKVTGTVRLSGAALAELRWACFRRDNGVCQDCGRVTDLSVPDCFPTKFDMAHIKSRGAGGSDTLDNVRTLCHACHMKEHTEGVVREGAA